jgi:putative ABC transport system substrate-binding protein
MRRRQFLGLTAAALASLAPTAFARAANPPHIGWMWPGRSADNPNEVKGFRQGLRDLGYVESQNIFVEYRFGEGNGDRLKDFAAEFVGLRLDVIVLISGSAAIAVRNTGTTIPIVALTGDLVGDHFIESMRHPGGTITGISFMQGPTGANLTGKRLQLLKEAIPSLIKVGFLYNPEVAREDLAEVERVAPKLELALHSAPVKHFEDAKAAIARLKKDGVEAIDVDAAPPLIAYQRETVELALDLRLPTSSEQPEFSEDGGLLSYGPSIFDGAKRQAYFVDRILKGAKPADLPAEAPAKFELDVNLKTAKALGLAIPESMLLRADKVIE